MVLTVVRVLVYYFVALSPSLSIASTDRHHEVAHQGDENDYDRQLNDRLRGKLRKKDHLKDFRDNVPSPTVVPSLSPTNEPTITPTTAPSFVPTSKPTRFAEPTFAPTTAPSLVPTGKPTRFATKTDSPSTTFECGGELTSQAIDIVIAVDESKSMGNEQDAVRNHVNTLFNKISTETNGRFRIALVGYTGPRITNEDGQTSFVEVDPELKIALTNNQVDFEKAVASLVTEKFDKENTRGTLLKIAQNQIRDLSGQVVPLAGPNQPFPSSRGMCALAITDEGNQAYNNPPSGVVPFPDPGNPAVLAEYRKTDSVIFMVAPRDSDLLRALAENTGGEFLRTGLFVEDPSSFFDSMVEKCVRQLCEE